jgi:cytochrome c oxidase subunit 4
MKTATRTYLHMWTALLVLIAVTCGSAFVQIGVWNVVVNYAVALAQILLIVVFFMHLRRGNALLRMAAGTGIVWLSILAALSLLDAYTRGGGLH